MCNAAWYGARQSGVVGQLDFNRQRRSRRGNNDGTITTNLKPMYKKSAQSK